jgi:hypothetical protein
MPWRRLCLGAFGFLAFVYGVAYVDLVLRARSAYFEGEKHMAWAKDGSLKKAALDRELGAREAELRARAAKEGWDAQALEQRLFLARFERDERLKESSLKYAYVWYQTAVELFTPPESKWVALCRQRSVEAKRLWKQELDAQKIPYQDYMLE